MAEAKEHDVVTFRAMLVALGVVLWSTALSVFLETSEQVFLVGEAAVRDNLAEIFAVHVELLLAAFGVLSSAKTVTPTRLAGPLVHAYHWLFVATFTAFCCVLLVGVILPQRFSDAGFVYWLFRVVLPDTAAIVILVYAALAAQRVERDVREHVDLQ